MLDQELIPYRYSSCCSSYSWSDALQKSPSRPPSTCHGLPLFIHTLYDSNEHQCF